MRALILTTNSPFGELPFVSAGAGGAEVSLRRLASRLASRGHDVTYLSTARRGLEPSLRFDDRWIDGVAVLHLRGPSVPVLNRLASRVHRAAFERAVGDVCEERAIDVAVTYATLPDTLALVRARRRQPGLRVVEWMAGRAWELHLREHPADLELVREAFEGKDATVFETRALAAYTDEAERSLGLRRRGEVHLVDFGVDPLPQARRSERDEVAALARERFVLCVASFKRGSKRQDILVEAFARHPDAFRGTLLVFVGSGEGSDKIRALAIRLGLEGQAVFLGHASRDDVAFLLRSASAFALPTEFEGKPQALLEAVGAGLPFVVSDIPAHREVVSPSAVLGEMCLSPNEPDAFAARLSAILDDGSARERVLRGVRVLAADVGASAGMDGMIRLLEEIVSGAESDGGTTTRAGTL